MAKVRARAEGRIGAPIHQPLRDLRKLLTKEPIHAEHSSAVLAIAPFVLVATAAVAIAISPLVTTTPVLARSADLFVVVFLLLMGSVALALAGLDAGTAFGGMGSSRAMTIGALAEPALLVAMLALSIQAGNVEPAGDRRGDARASELGGGPGAPARLRRVPDRGPRRDRADPGRQSLDPSRADDDPRGDGARVRRT